MHALLNHASGWLVAGAVVSLALSLGGLWAARWFAISLPPDYFTAETEPDSFNAMHPLARWSWWIVKNLVGWLLIAAGVVMLLAPGPGVLAILAGLCLVSVPGKRTLVLWLLSGRHVLSAMNAVRARAGAPPLESPRDRP